MPMHSPCISSSLVILPSSRPFDIPDMDSYIKISLNFLIYFSLLGRPFNKIHMQALNLYQAFN